MKRQSILSVCVFLLLIPLHPHPTAAHNGAVAIAVPVEGIMVGTTVQAGPGRKGRAGPGVRKGAWQTFGMADGLPSPEVRCIYQDRQHNLWFATDGGGVSRYDGASITTFTTDDGLASNHVLSILEDSDGRMWFGTGGSAGEGLQVPGQGICAYDGTYFTTLTTEDGLADNTVFSIAEDQNGHMWFGTGQGVSCYDGNQVTSLTASDGLGAGAVQSILEDRNGYLWFGTKEGGVSRYDGEEFTIFTTGNGLAGNNVRAISMASDGNLWFGTGGGASVYDGQDMETPAAKDGLSPTNILSIAQDTRGDLWFGTDNRFVGVTRYDGERFDTFTTDDGLASNIVFSILLDQEGGLWFGAGGGVSRYGGDRCVTLTRDDGLPSNTVTRIHIDTRGDVWLGTSLGLCRYDGEKLVAFTQQDGVVEGGVSVFYEDSRGELWIGETEGATRYHEGQFTAYTTEHGLAGSSIWGITEDCKGHIWLATGGGASRYDRKEFVSFTSADGLANDRIYTVLRDSKGNLWFGTQGGVTRYDGVTFVSFGAEEGIGRGVYAIMEDQSGNMWFLQRGVQRMTGSTAIRYDGITFSTYGPSDGLSNSIILDMAEDDDGNIWFSTWGGGISRFNGDSFTTFTTSDGLASNFLVSDPLVDRHGRVWVGSVSGVSVLDGSVFQSILERDGLASNTVEVIVEDDHGNIWMGGDGGVTRYRPGTILPKVDVTQVVWDRKYAGTDRVSSSSLNKYLSFAFVARSFSSRPGQMVYLYRLQGYEDEWKQTRELQVEYTDLPVGEYEFQIKAVDRDLNYSEEPATVKVTVHPPYGQIALWSGLGVSLIGLIIASGYGIKRNRERNRAQQERLELQEQINQELEEELQTAHDMQMGLMPIESPQISGFDIAGRCLPANHVGGDFFQYFPISNNRLAISLADVTGHAMEAAVPVMMFSGILDNQMEAGDSLEELFSKLNRSLHRNLGSRTFVCFTMGELGTATRKFRLSNGGCPYPYHYKADSGEISELQVDAYPLGVRAETDYPVIETQLESGDRIVFCSDGIIEAENSQDEIFGFERTAKTIKNGCSQDLSAPQLLDYLINEVKQFTGETPQGDDQTVVVLRVEA